MNKRLITLQGITAALLPIEQHALQSFQLWHSHAVQPSLGQSCTVQVLKVVKALNLPPCEHLVVCVLRTH